jgi:hypothetical protein
LVDIPCIPGDPEAAIHRSLDAGYSLKRTELRSIGFAGMEEDAGRFQGVVHGK